MTKPSDWRCANCGTTSPDGNKPCDCTTWAAYRDVDGQTETKWWADYVEHCPCCGQPIAARKEKE